ncbi:hypothetical protein, partial [Bacteroides faecis]|uniref:hypothetical protein n=1 Tax=Bacteroides faecis TaxID=674529 RepID=UPI001863CDE6
AIGLNPIKLDAIGLDPIRMNAIRLGVPGASSGSARPYIDPDLLKHVKMAISTWGKSNDDPDRAILKDLSGNGNDMRLLNFGFAEGSGYGLYGTDFTTYQTVPASVEVVRTHNKLSATNHGIIGHMIIYKTIEDSSSYPDTPAFKIKVTNLTSELRYFYVSETNTAIRTSIAITSDGVYDLPESKNTLFNGTEPINIGFSTSAGGSVTIEQLPDFEGWLCTDGVDDMIVSEKTVDEMIGDSKECTVISIINYISDIGSDHVNVLGKRFIRNNMFERNGLNGKYYICGYTSSSINEIGNVTVVNDILGDKNDFTASYPTAAGVADYFSVIGYLDTNNVPRKCVKIAYAGGFIANKVLTTDEINQIIAYYNLDRPGQIIKPQLYYNIKKQGITNDNHAEFNDQLIDFVGGHNIQLNNIGWEGESGINSYPVVFGANKTWETYATYNFTSNINGNELHITKVLNSNGLIFSYVKRNNELLNIKEIPSFDIEVIGLEGESKLQYYYLSEENAANITILTLENGVHKIPKSFIPTDILPNSTWIGFRITPIQEGVSSFDCDITIEVLPTIEHALCLDGINDFGKVTGLPVLKDYTVVADYERIRINIGSNGDAAVLSKAESQNNGAFMFNTISNNGEKISYSFGGRNIINTDDTIRRVFYQSKYINNGQYINIIPTFVDSDKLWLGTYRDNDTRFAKLALWSLMLFPYSLSEFLLERQLRKFKAGTLYPDMVEFRPVIKSNVPYSSVSYSVNPGRYIAEGSTVTITITLENASDKLIGVSSNAISDISISGDNGTYEITGKVTKSPQKISIVISSYLTMLGNETLISNETLIKNE